jgi:hypothetical protein
MNVKRNLNYANICKHEHEMNITKLWCKIILKTSVEQTKRNEWSYFYLYPFGDLTKMKLPRRLLCVHQVKKLFENLFNSNLT